MDTTLPFRTAPIPLELIAYLNQTTDVAEVEAEIEELRRTGGCTGEDILRSLETKMAGRPEDEASRSPLLVIGPLPRKEPTPPFLCDPMPPDFFSVVQQDFDEAKYLAGVRELERSGGHRLDEFLDEIDPAFRAATLVSGAHRVVYSDQVRQRLRELGRTAAERGDGDAYVSALQEFDRRLRHDPRFGERYAKPADGPGQVLMAFVRPLHLRWGIQEDRRTVLITDLPVLLPLDDPRPHIATPAPSRYTAGP